MLALKITKPELGNRGYVLRKDETKNLLGEIDVMLDYGEVGESLLITVEDIPKERLDSLEEFTGW